MLFPRLIGKNILNILLQYKVNIFYYIYRQDLQVEL